MLLKAKLVTRSRGRRSGKIRTTEFDSEARVLRRKGKELPRLTTQEAALLTMLIEAAPGVVDLESIERRLWNGKPAESSHTRIRAIVSKVRELLGDSADEPCWIENVPCQGYAFVGSVEEYGPAAKDPPSSTELQLKTENNEPYKASNADELLEVSEPAPGSTGTESSTGYQWRDRWPYLLALPFFVIFTWAAIDGAFGLAVSCLCFGSGPLLLGYLRAPAVVYWRAAIASLALFAMAYLPSAATLAEVMTTVVNAEMLRPAFLYPFVTGLKFVPLFSLALGYWVMQPWLTNGGVCTRKNLRTAFLLLGPLSLTATAMSLASASGDWQSLQAGVSEISVLFGGYIAVIIANLTVWWASYQHLKAEISSSFRPMLATFAIAYFVTAFAGAAVDHEYNRINEFSLDQRRPQAFVAENPGAVAEWRQLPGHAEVGGKLGRMLDDPQFRRALRTELFYKQNFDEPFQLGHRAVMLGYKPGGSKPDSRPPFVIIRFPQELADALGFEKAGN